VFLLRKFGNSIKFMCEVYEVLMSAHRWYSRLIDLFCHLQQYNRTHSLLKLMEEDREFVVLLAQVSIYGILRN